MSSRLTLLCCLLLTACGGGDPDPVEPDAGADLVDADPAAVCTGAVYDSCADTAASSDCGAGLACHFFGTANLTVCVPACDAATPCPDQDGVEVRCNNMGRCRPDVASACALP